MNVINALGQDGIQKRGENGLNNMIELSIYLDDLNLIKKIYNNNKLFFLSNTTDYLKTYFVNLSFPVLTNEDFYALEIFNYYSSAARNTFNLKKNISLFKYRRKLATMDNGTESGTISTKTNILPVFLLNPYSSTKKINNQSFISYYNNLPLL